MSAVGRVVTAVEGAGVVGHSVEIVGRRRAARGRLPAVVTGGKEEIHHNPNLISN